MQKFLCILFIIFGSTATKDRSTMHPKFNPTGVRTHDLQIMTAFHVTETSTLTTQPSVTYTFCLPSVVPMATSYFIIPLSVSSPAHDAIIPSGLLCST